MHNASYVCCGLSQHAIETERVKELAFELPAGEVFHGAIVE